MERRLFLALALLPVSTAFSKPSHAAGSSKHSIADLARAAIPKPIKLLYTIGELLYHIYCNRTDIISLLQEFQRLYSEVGLQGLMDQRKDPATKIIKSLARENKSKEPNKTASRWGKWAKWPNRLYNLLTELGEDDWRTLLIILNDNLILKDSSGDAVKDENGQLILVGGEHPVFRKALKFLSNGDDQKPAGCL